MAETVTHAVGAPEGDFQGWAMGFFEEELGYRYRGSMKGGHGIPNLFVAESVDFLVNEMGVKETMAAKAVETFRQATTNLTEGLAIANRRVYDLLKYGVKIRPTPDAAPQTILLVDFKHPERNHFSIGEEVTVEGCHEKRPDAVVYVNGIALGVVELKKSTVSVKEAIRQIIQNQKESNIASFFSTVQFCVAANPSEGARYGTVGTREEFYLEWQEDGHKTRTGAVLGAADIPEVDRRIAARVTQLKNKAAQQLLALFDKARFLDLIYNFVIFDSGIKKVCRYNQYYGIKRAQRRIVRVQHDPQAKGRGGILWHTQGSGKSLTMVWLAKWLHANNPQARVLIVTDREELDEQIEALFLGVGETIQRATSCRNLLSLLNQFDDHFICSLIHKFGHRAAAKREEDEEAFLVKDYEKYIRDLKNSLPRDFAAKGQLIVFVDECHRTQSGMLHTAMKEILPTAIFVGFTGTPLLKKDKPTTLHTFGDYIHCYKFDEAVRDGVIVDIHYEARDVPQELRSEEKIDEWFQLHTEGLTDIAKERLLQRWTNLSHLLSSHERLKRIACDILFDFGKVVRLKEGRGNAMLVADSIYNALRYWKIFHDMGFTKCVPIVSYRPTANTLRTAPEGGEAEQKAKLYWELLGVDASAPDRTIEQKADALEKEAKNLFKHQPEAMKLLIVVDKLLTGFDAPPCSRLYIDKMMHDHGLFQAICRVNRKDDDEKLFGTIIDYRGLFEDVQDVVHLYSQGPLTSFDREDVDGLIKRHAEQTQDEFKHTLEGLRFLCENVPPPRGMDEYRHFFCKNGPDDTRDEVTLVAQRKVLYQESSKLLRLYGELAPYMTELGYTPEQKSQTYNDVVFFFNLRLEIGRVSGDFLDLDAMDYGMRFLIDNYINAKDAAPIGDFTDISLTKTIDTALDQAREPGTPYDDPSRKKREESAAETIENNLEKEIVRQQNTNHAFFLRLSTMLQNIIEQRKQQVLSYIELLEKYRDLNHKKNHPETDPFYPPEIRPSSSLRRLYENFSRVIPLIQQLDTTIRQNLRDGWRDNLVIQRAIKRELHSILHDPQQVETLFSLIRDEPSY